MGYVLLILVGFACCYFASSIVKEIVKKVKERKRKPPKD